MVPSMSIDSSARSGGRASNTLVFGLGMAPLRIRRTMALGERFQLAIHHLEDEAGATVRSLVRSHLPLERRLAGRRGRRTSEPLGLHGRFQRPSPIKARDQNSRKAAAERLRVVVLDGDAVDRKLRHGIPRVPRAWKDTTTRTIPPWLPIRQSEAVAGRGGYAVAARCRHLPPRQCRWIQAPAGILGT